MAQKHDGITSIHAEAFEHAAHTVLMLSGDVSPSVASAVAIDSAISYVASALLGLTNRERSEAITELIKATGGRTEPGDEQPPVMVRCCWSGYDHCEKMATCVMSVPCSWDRSVTLRPLCEGHAKIEAEFGNRGSIRRPLSALVP